MTYHQRSKNMITNVSRRGLLKGAAGTASFVLAAQLPAVRTAQAYATGAGAMAHGVVTNPHVFVSIDKDGTVRIVAHRAEMGTGAARTTLPMIVADELEADWSRLHDPDPRPVGIKLVGDDQRQGRAGGAGAHLRAVRDDVDGAVLLD